jgi:hypothetical protein
MGVDLLRLLGVSVIVKDDAAQFGNLLPQLANLTLMRYAQHIFDVIAQRADWQGYAADAVRA